PVDFVRAQLKDVGVIRERDSPESFPYKYIPKSEATEAPAGKWRWKYFLDTRLGFWTGGECFQAKSRDFTAHGADERAARVRDLRSPDLKAWWRLMSDRLLTVSRGLQVARRDPNDY